MQITFCGAANTVTGSCYWVRGRHGQFLVDCGMFQGAKSLKQLNYGDFPFDPHDIDFVLLTHAHIDHSGLIPKLTKRGFSGAIYCTKGTYDLLSYMLPDSGNIQATEVERLNRRNQQRGMDEVEPIYDERDAKRSLERFEIVDYETWGQDIEGVRFRFWNAGHILGSASIEVEVDDRASTSPTRILFSGDLGPNNKLFHPDPEAPQNWDYVICEGTYGGRSREELSPEQRRRVLADEVNTALARGGNLLIPSFAVERTQELLLDLIHLVDNKSIRDVPIFLDSPLAIRATEVFGRNADLLEDTKRGKATFERPNITFTESVEESKFIAKIGKGAIIIAGSGMCDAGRIRHHLKKNLWRSDATVLLVGYQAPGTLGSVLAGGASAVKIFGEDVRVRATIRQIDIYSGHADNNQLIAWVQARRPIKNALFLTHGEEEALVKLRDNLISVGFSDDSIIIPCLDDAVDFQDQPPSIKVAPPRRRLEPEFVGGLDWHNDLADFSLRLRDVLDKAADERSRKKVLRALNRAIDELEK